MALDRSQKKDLSGVAASQSGLFPYFYSTQHGSFKKY
jgi:hypothetical protein